MTDSVIGGLLPGVSNGQMAAAAAVAVVVFWMLGAYNRLMALRNAVGRAWQQVDDVLGKRAAAVQPLVALLRGPLGGEQGALDALLAAEAQVRAAADALRERPLAPAPAAALKAAESAMAAAGSRVVGLLDQHAGLRRDASVAPLVALLQDSAGRLAFARQSYNDAAALYDAAAQQFPTRLLTRSFGFGAAGRL